MATKKKASNSPTVTDSVGMDDWKAESDMRTLLQAAEIKADKKRYAAARKIAKEKLEEMETEFGEDDEKDDKK